MGARYDKTVHAAHRLYKLTLSPFVGRTCRFLPTCSDYAAEALTVHGPLRGAALTAGRLCRCHPLGGRGYDPVPARAPPARALSRAPRWKPQG